MDRKNILNNQNGQSLVEYLVIVAFVGVASIGVVRVLGKNISVNLGNISNSLGGKEKIDKFEDAEKFTNKKDFSNFMDNAKGK